MDLSLLNSKAWKCEAFEPQPAPETIWPILSKLDLKPLTNWQGADLTDLQETRLPLYQGCSFFFHTDKIEKLHVGFAVFMNRLVATTTIIWPNDNYDFPMLGIELIESLNNTHFTMDMSPLRDLAIDSWYREKYLDPFGPIWKQYQDLNNDILPLPWLRALYSPYPMIGRILVETTDRSELSRATDLYVKFLEYYIDHVIPNAEPIKDPQAKEFVIKKKKAIRNLYQTSKDPSTAVMIKLLGVEEAKKRLHSLF